MESEDPSAFLTKIRKWKNAAAQRNYRRRQKQTRRRLEQRAAEAALRLQEPQYTGTIFCASINEYYVGASFSSSSIDLDNFTAKREDKLAAVSVGLSSSDIYSCLLLCTSTQNENFTRIVSKEGFCLSDIIKYGLIIMGYAVNPELLKYASFLPAQDWIRCLKPSLGNVNFKQVITAGITFIARLNPPSEPEAKICSLSTLNQLQNSPPSRILTTFSKISCTLAILINARRLGVSNDELLNGDSESPFRRHRSRQKEYLNDACSKGEDFSWLESTMPDLAPTMAQLTIPHHPRFDLIPWPSFRSNFLAAISHEPPLVDQDDFTLDLMNDGVWCWGPANGSTTDGHSQAATWDSRNWEASEWFLKKWGYLIDGVGNDVAKNTLWWQSLRRTEGNCWLPRTDPLVQHQR